MLGADVEAGEYKCRGVQIEILKVVRSELGSGLSMYEHAPGTSS